MPRIGTSVFSGIRPAVSPRLLGDTEAQTADNCDLTSGELRQIKRPLVVESLSLNGVEAFMFYDLAGEKAWLAWTDEGTSVVRGHLHEDEYGRCYLSDADGAKIFTVADVSGTFSPKKLGIPAPTAIPTASTDGAGAGEVVTTGYIFTLVSIYGEESAPSPASELIGRKDGDTVSLSGLITPDVTDYNVIEYKRIYRLMTGDSGSTEFQWVADIDVSDTTYNDTVGNDSLGEGCPTEGWLEPPDGLRGMISNDGLYAGFVGRNLWYCEPYYPFAWPLKYNQTVEADIVGHCFNGDYQVVLTTGKAYVVDCSDITYAVPRGLQGQAPCLSAKGIANSPYGVLYPGQDGLYLIDPTSSYAVNITKNKVFGEDDWKAMQPKTMVATWYLQKYFCFYEDTSGGKRGFVLDVNSDGIHRARGLGFYASAVHVTPDGNNFYMASESIGRTDISKWAGSVLSYRAEWRSKIYKTASEVNMAASLIEADFRDGLSEDEFTAMLEETILANTEFVEEGEFGGELGASGPGEYVFGGDALDGIFVHYIEVPQVVLKLWGDGVLRATKEVNNGQPFTLPAGYAAKEWEFAVSADILVKSVNVATSMMELMG